MRILGRVNPKKYAMYLQRAYATLCVPGLGYDTFRVFETLFAGAMPVLERSIGLDRSWHKLPVLQLDDFAMVTPELIRQAALDEALQTMSVKDAASFVSQTLKVSRKIAYQIALDRNQGQG